jgi:hypothetical protein
MYLETDWHATVIQSDVVVQIEGPRTKRRKTAKLEGSQPQQQSLECTEDTLGATDVISQTVASLQLNEDLWKLTYLFVAGNH